MFKDQAGVAFSVALEPHGDMLAVVVAHPAYGGGKRIAVTGVRAEAGALDSVKAWVEMLSGATPPPSLRDLDGTLYLRA